MKKDYTGRKAFELGYVRTLLRARHLLYKFGRVEFVQYLSRSLNTY